MTNALHWSCWRSLLPCSSSSLPFVSCCNGFPICQKDHSSQPFCGFKFLTLACFAWFPLLVLESMELPNGYLLVAVSYNWFLHEEEKHLLSVDSSNAPICSLVAVISTWHPAIRTPSPPSPVNELKKRLRVWSSNHLDWGFGVSNHLNWD